VNAVAANIKARQEAEALVDLAGEQPPRFWETLRDMSLAKLPPVPAPIDRHPPMDESAALRFERGVMPYGKHAGERIDEVPCDYLIFLTEGDEFSQQLRRYVKSRLLMKQRRLLAGIIGTTSRQCLGSSASAWNTVEN